MANYVCMYVIPLMVLLECIIVSSPANTKSAVHILEQQKQKGFQKEALICNTTPSTWSKLFSSHIIRILIVIVL